MGPKSKPCAICASRKRFKVHQRINYKKVRPSWYKNQGIDTENIERRVIEGFLGRKICYACFLKINSGNMLFSDRIKPFRWEFNIAGWNKYGALEYCALVYLLDKTEELRLKTHSK